MDDRVRVIRKKELEVNRWSGGTTTQLFIYPEDAQYRERNFLWRLSTATIEIEESTFTSLPGISRILMIIEGRIIIAHQGDKTVELGPYQQHSFMGDWDTKSFGKATDFNIMTAKGVQGKLEVISLLDDNSIAIVDLGMGNNKLESATEVFYVTVGEVEALIEGERTSLYKGDLITIRDLGVESKSAIAFVVKGCGQAKIVRATMVLNNDLRGC